MYKYLSLSLGLFISALVTSAGVAEVTLLPAATKAKATQSPCQAIDWTSLGFATKSHHDHRRIKEALEADSPPCHTKKQ